jgi:multicomponent K+:H+ antiporter subunit A
LRRFRPALESIETPRAQREDGSFGTQHLPDPKELLPPNHMMVPAVLVRLLLPMAGLVSLFFLLRGHDLPGGGFIGGLVLATAVIVQYMVGGAIWVEARTRIQPLYWIALGLLGAGTAGTAAWFAGRTFLTSLTYDLHLPLIGDVHLSTTLWFDIGVYMLVVGATVLMLVALAHQSLRSYRRPAAATSGTDVHVDSAVAPPTAQADT